MYAPDWESPDAPVDWASPVNWDHPLNRGRVAWWLTPDDAARWQNARWIDLCGPSGRAPYDATLTNGPACRPTTRPGGSGCINFDGTDDYAEANNPLASNTAFSVAAWANFAAIGANYTSVVDGGNLGSGSAGFTLCLTNTGKPLFAVDAGFQTGPAALTAPTGWTHLCGVYTAVGSSTPVLYVNGASVSGGGSGATSSSTQNAKVRVGYAVRNTLLRLNGQADDVALFARALSAGEVLQLIDLSRRGHPGVLARVPQWSPVAAGYLPQHSSQLVGTCW